MSPSIHFSLSGILSQTYRIVSPHSRHFLALSVIFLLPLSLLSDFQLLLSRNTTALLLRDQPPPQPHTTANFLFPLLSTLFSIFLSLCAVGTITDSVTDAFFGRPVKLAASLSSLLRSFLPLLLTSLASQLLYFAICFVAALVFAVGVLSFHLLVSEIDYTSTYFILICVLASSALLICVLYFQVNWVLAPVVVVAENTWGFEPLKRSTNLVQGKKLVVLSYLLFFGLGLGLLTRLSCLGKRRYFYNGDGSWKTPVQFVIKGLLVTVLRVLVVFFSVAAETVLYQYCKGISGELAGEVPKEFRDAYVSLPVEEGV